MDDNTTEQIEIHTVIKKYKFKKPDDGIVTVDWNGSPAENPILRIAGTNEPVSWEDNPKDRRACKCVVRGFEWCMKILQGLCECSKDYPDAARVVDGALIFGRDATMKVLNPLGLPEAIVNGLTSAYGGTNASDGNGNLPPEGDQAQADGEENVARAIENPFLALKIVSK